MRKRNFKDESKPIRELSELAKGVGPVFNRDNKRKSRMGLRALGVAMVLLFAAANAQADYLNLQTAGSSGTIGTAIFSQGAQLSGTGVFPAFVQVAGGGSPPIHDAYNTTVNNVLFNGSSDTFNYTLTLADMVTVNVNGTNYFQFFLDINENNNAIDKYLSLDELRVFSGPVALNQSTTDVDGVAPFPLGTLRYDMDAGSLGNGILLNYDLETGSGRADMVFLVQAWAGASTDAVYLYSKFGVIGTGTPTCNHTGGVTGGAAGCGVAGGDYGNSDGFEEWALGTGGSVIPEPSTYALYALGISMLLVSGWWQRHRKALSLPTL
jgi:hypothetical protein